ncbi:MAG: CinA family nicotinamide mononucleotide deamidase-related protein [Tannerellaceae bacterium]|jgi:nicotinamide-nucleotide amidase|nr:CinA family nicotinamide mononucleotide deamidase-related protein [Tannerellaceae bacterium]
MKVEIITIGDELLRGQVIDSNSSWMGQELERNGFRVLRRVSVGDSCDDIEDAIDASFSRVDIVLLTGGLGPTKDDVTLSALCRYFKTELHFSEETYANICSLFNKSNWKMNELTRLQAMVPVDCTVIQNRVGTAPCTWFTRSGKTLVSMPGVPYEMRRLMLDDVVPRLRASFGGGSLIRHHTLLTGGISESALAMRLRDFEEELPQCARLAYLPQLGVVRLRLTAFADGDETVPGMIVERGRQQLHELLSDYILGEGDEALEAIVGKELLSRGLTLGTAESCTGGRIASMLTSISGSSQYFSGSVIAYCNEIKVNVLGVSANDINLHGAVSRPVVEQMAMGALRILGCDCALAVSGIAGPSGGTSDKPVGTVWIALAMPEGVVAETYCYNSEREVNIQRSANLALSMLLRELRRMKR